MLHSYAPAALLLAAAAAAYVRRSGGASAGLSFVLPPGAASAGAIVRTQAGGLQHRAAVAPQFAAPASSGSNIGAAVVAAGAAAMAVLGLSLHRRSTSVARQARGQYERKWTLIEDTRDPCTLPYWQRDHRYGYMVLKKTMLEKRKLGEKVYWDVRVVESQEKGCKVEMLNSGLYGFCTLSQEGPERLEVGKVYKMECTRCPQKRIYQETNGYRRSPWPLDHRPQKTMPFFSHWNWIEGQKKIAKAPHMTAGTIITGTVHAHITRGILIDLDGNNGAKGFLQMVDVSRRLTDRWYAKRMFPPGTVMKCYVIHSDLVNGRITLGTKEFEDDDHMGWMLSFPEYCFSHAEEMVAKYHQKRDRYIKFLQR